MKFALIISFLLAGFCVNAQELIKFGSIDYEAEFKPLYDVQDYLEIANPVIVRRIEVVETNPIVIKEVIPTQKKIDIEPIAQPQAEPIKAQQPLVVKVPKTPVLNSAKNMFEQIQDLEKIVLNDNTNLENIIKLGSIYNAYNKFQKSLEILKPIESSINTNEELMLIQADANMGTKKYPLAIVQYEKLVQTKPSKILYQKLADAYEKMRNKNKSIFYMQKLVDIDSTNYNVLHRMALLQMDYNNYTEAIKWFKKAEERQMPVDENYYLNLGTSYKQLKDFNNAITMFEKANELTGGYNVDVIEQLMYGYYDGKQFEKARTYVDKLLEINPEDADMVYMKGMTYLRENKKNKAEEYFNKAFAMKPELMKLRQAKMQL